MKKILVCIVFAMLQAVVILAVDQASPPGWKGTIATENGVKVVKNPGQPLYGEFSFALQEDLSIGGDPVKEDYYFPQGAALSIEKAGNLYVRDFGNGRVMMYDSAGKFIRQLGRRGQGPGEYQYPSDVFFDADGNPMVYSTRELVRFGKDGAFNKKVPIKAFVSPAILGPGNTLIGRTQPGPGPGGPMHRLLLSGANGEVLRTIAEYRGEFNESQTAILIHAYSNNLALAPLTPETFVYGFPEDYRLHVAEAEGRTVLTIAVEERPLPISGKERTEIKKKGASISIATNDNTIRDSDFPDHRPFFVRLFTDDAGRIYVARTKSILDKDKPWEIDVFSKDGFYLYRMSWPSFPSAIQGGCWYGVRTDKDSGEYFVVRSKIKNWSAMKTG